MMNGAISKVGYCFKEAGEPMIAVGGNQYRRRLDPAGPSLSYLSDPDSTEKLERARAREISFEIVGKPIPPRELLEKLAALHR